jgi:peptidoglycan biosynthesis protein MviN/MurJ (putative lipid II flippase)
MLDKRVGGIGLAQNAPNIVKMIIASGLMWLACLAVQHSPLYPLGDRKYIWACQLALLMITGGATYFVACAAMGIDVMKHVRRRRAVV